MQVPQVVPQIIHFIWAGGIKLLPDDSINVILRWAHVNIPDGFEIWLWVDKKTYPEGLVGLINAYNTAFNNVKREVASPIINSLIIDFSDPNCKFKLKDVEEELISSHHCRYEIDKLLPNYGASSDLLRYALLLKIGGAYFDSDVYPSNAKRLAETKLFGSRLNPILGYTSNSQATGMIGNDTFICSRSNPLMRKILEEAEKNYLLTTEDKEDTLLSRLTEAYNSQSPGYIKNATIYRTGPGLIHKILEPIIMSEAPDYHIVDIKDFVQVEPDSNTQHWLRVPLRRTKNLDEALQTVESTVLFEIKHFKVLRLDSHAMELFETAKLSGFHFNSLEEAAKLLCEKIYRHATLNQLTVIQLTLSIGTTINFCSQNKYDDKLFIFPSTLPRHFTCAVNGATRAPDLERFKGNIKRNDLVFFKNSYQEVCAITNEMLNLMNLDLARADSERNIKKMDNILKNIISFKSILIDYYNLADKLNQQHDAGINRNPLRQMLDKIQIIESKCSEKLKSYNEQKTALSKTENNAESKQGGYCNPM